MLESTPETQRIMVVDDSAYTLRIVQHTLEGAGYTVSTAISGPEALKLITRYGLPHLAIVDYHMPEMSGFEFCRTIHEFSDVPVIMLTAVSTEETIIEGLEQHAEDYVVKPFNPSGWWPACGVCWRAWRTTPTPSTPRRASTNGC